MRNFEETSIVRSLVIYDWSTKLDLARVRDLLDRIVESIGKPPDVASVLDDKKGRDYQFTNFVKRRNIEQKRWHFLGYLWKRSEDSHSDFAIDLRLDIGEFQRFELHVDEAAMPNTGPALKPIFELVVGELLPSYGIGFRMPYFWGPRAFSRGTVSTRFATVDKTFYGPPEWQKKRSYAFGPTFLSNTDKHTLLTHIRDVFEVNLISTGHLMREIEGMTLHDWIFHNGIGKLRQLNAVTWQWDVPHDEIDRVRLPLIAAGIAVVKA